MKRALYHRSLRFMLLGLALLGWVACNGSSRSPVGRYVMDEEEYLDAFAQMMEEAVEQNPELHAGWQEGKRLMEQRGGMSGTILIKDDGTCQVTLQDGSAPAESREGPCHVEGDQLIFPDPSENAQAPPVEYLYDGRAIHMKMTAFFSTPLVLTFHRQ